ncbi:hypothetical protein GGR50DRAFT_652287, partial [Xylaria sp. CBS 124048]
MGFFFLLMPESWFLIEQTGEMSAMMGFFFFFFSPGGLSYCGGSPYRYPGNYLLNVFSGAFRVESFSGAQDNYYVRAFTYGDGDVSKLHIDGAVTSIDTYIFYLPYLEGTWTSWCIV